MKRTTLQGLVISVAVLAGAAASAASLDDIQFIKISPKDARAVIKGGDGKLIVIKPGDSIAENVTVKEIAPGRIVLEEKADNGRLETVIVRIVNDKAKIERMRKEPENRPGLAAPTKNGN
jgi:hypothetical protein